MHLLGLIAVRPLDESFIGGCAESITLSRTTDDPSVHVPSRLMKASCSVERRERSMNHDYLQRVICGRCDDRWVIKSPCMEGLNEWRRQRTASPSNEPHEHLEARVNIAFATHISMHGYIINIPGDGLGLQIPTMSTGREYRNLPCPMAPHHTTG